VFFPVLANLAKPSILAVSLGFAAGIMMYISLVDIYGKAVQG
jgi:zinc transporter ZupT